MVKRSPIKTNKQIHTIVSASRRTDIPAFQGRNFLRAVSKGEIDVPNPFSGKLYTVSLRPEDVGAIVFWSRNYAPFFPVLDKIRNLYNDRFLFHFTITGYQAEAKEVLEPHCPNIEQSVKCLKKLSDQFGKEKIFWRFDPVIFSDLTPFSERLEVFQELVEEIQPYVARCYFSFIDIYKKVENRLQKYNKKLRIADPKFSQLVNFSKRIKSIADEYELPLYSCCEPEINSATNIRKGHCVDSKYLTHLFPGINFTYKINPTRPGCGCYDSRDIGQYDTCQYNCLYCYANK